MSIFKILPTFKTIKQVKDFVGFEPLSKPEKMPEYAFNIPAQECKAGSHMVGVKGMICEHCYALKNRYAFENTLNAMYNRLNFTKEYYFITVMTFLIIKREIKSFRWFDSGDIQSKEMLDDICEICRNTPDTEHWLPTKEWKLVRNYIYAGNVIPDNLNIRLSALRVNGKPPTKLAEKLGLTTSTVVTPDVYDKLKFKCPSSKQGNKCESCRACWSKKVKNVSYKYH